jgi:hypothetical protein
MEADFFSAASPPPSTPIFSLIWAEKVFTPNKGYKNQGKTAP